MAYWLRPRGALHRTLVLFQHPHGDLEPSVIVVSDYCPPLNPEGTRHTYGTHTDIQAKHSCIKQNKI